MRFARQVSLMDFVKGYATIDADVTVQPATTIRGAAGLEWNTRPGRYLQAQSELIMSLRMAVPLKEMKGEGALIFCRVSHAFCCLAVALFMPHRLLLQAKSTGRKSSTGLCFSWTTR